MYYADTKSNYESRVKCRDELTMGKCTRHTRLGRESLKRRLLSRVHRRTVGLLKSLFSDNKSTRPVKTNSSLNRLTVPLLEER